MKRRIINIYSYQSFFPQPVSLESIVEGIGEVNYEYLNTTPILTYNPFNEIVCFVERFLIVGVFYQRINNSVFQIAKFVMEKWKNEEIGVFLWGQNSTSRIQHCERRNVKMVLLKIIQ